MGGLRRPVRQFVCEDELRVNGRTLAPPVLIRCVWRREDEVDRRRPRQFRSVMTFANQPSGEIGDVVYGEAELLDAIRRLPELRFKLPSVLSLDAAPPDPEALARSTIDIEATRELARVFVPTPAWHHAVAVLKAHHFLVLTGPPEMGKTAIARMLGLALLTEGWEVHECTRPEQIEERFDRERPQLFIADDAFGSTEYRPDAAERWASELDRILRATRRAPLARLDLAPGAAARRACAGCTASAAASASRTRPRCRSTRPRSASRRRR